MCLAIKRATNSDGFSLETSLKRRRWRFARSNWLIVVGFISRGAIRRTKFRDSRSGFEASSAFARDAWYHPSSRESISDAQHSGRTEWIGENESNECVSVVLRQRARAVRAAIGVSREREISKCFNLFETPRLLIVRAADLCLSLSFLLSSISFHLLFLFLTLFLTLARHFSSPLPSYFFFFGDKISNFIAPLDLSKIRRQKYCKNFVLDMWLTFVSNDQTRWVAERERERESCC